MVVLYCSFRYTLGKTEEFDVMSVGFSRNRKAVWALLKLNWCKTTVSKYVKLHGSADPRDILI